MKAKARNAGIKGKAPISKTTLTLRIIWVLLGLFAAVTLISQLYITFYNPLQTEVVMIYETTDYINFKGVHIRNERLVHYGGVDVISYIHPDGSRMGRNSVVAKSYKNVEDVLLQQRIDRLEERVKILEEAEILVDTDKSQLESYVNQIKSRHTQLHGSVNSGDFTAVGQHKHDYISLQSRKRVIRGDAEDYREQINSLKNEIATLRSRMSAEPENVRIQEAGYFVSVTDGYESLLNYDRINTLGRNEIERIIREPNLEVSSDIIGKMIDGYKWRFVGVLDTSRTRATLYEGAVVNFRTGGNVRTVQATVINVRELDDDTRIVTFECDILTAEFASRRVSQFNLILEDFKGIRIPRSAIHFNGEGEQGVYVLNGAELIFRRIDVIKRERDFSIVADTTERPGYISLFDNVVTRGRDLYEGKIVR
jgi:putative membrane fusion protein